MKNIFLTLVLIFIAITAQAQKFAQVGVGLPLFDVSVESGFLGGTKMIDLQFGKFTSNRGMSSITVSYYTNATFKDKFGDSYYDPITGKDINFTYNYKIAVLSIGFERKLTFGYTEFDDTWNRYSILCIGLNQISVKEDGTIPSKSTFLDLELRPGTSFGLNYGLGFGWARKFTNDMYGYTEIRSYLQPGINGWGLGSGSARLIGLVNFGVRKLF